MPTMRIIVGISSQRHGSTKGLALEGCDTFQEEREIGSPVYWTLSCDRQGRQGGLPVGFSE